MTGLRLSPVWSWVIVLILAGNVIVLVGAVIRHWLDERYNRAFWERYERELREDEDAE